MEIVYKAFLRDEKGRLYSLIVDGKALTVYPMRMYYGKKWLVDLGYLPTGFRTKSAAVNFARTQSIGDHWEVWRCATHATSSPLPISELEGLCSLGVLHLFRKRGCALFDWPEETVFCKGIKPLEKVAETGA